MKSKVIVYLLFCVLALFSHLSSVAYAQISMATYSSNDDLEKEKELSKIYLNLMAQEPQAETIVPGVVVRPIYKSTSEIFPKETDNVIVSYHLVDRNGELIEESLSSDEVMNFPLTKLISCWKIALPKISTGSFYKVSCSSDTAYGDKGAGDGAIKPGAALTFRIHLYGVENH